MATKTARKTATRKPAKTARKSTKAAKAVATPEVDVRAAFTGFSGKGDYSKYCKGKHIRLNATGVELPTDGTQESFDKAANSHLRSFTEASTRWQASAAYGMQHYNREGFMHRDGLTRLDDDSLAMLVLQAGDELAQRAAFQGTVKGTEKRNPETAANFIVGLSSWLKGRPAAVKEDRKQQAYTALKSDIESGGEKTQVLQLRSEAN